MEEEGGGGEGEGEEEGEVELEVEEAVPSFRAEDSTGRGSATAALAMMDRLRGGEESTAQDSAGAQGKG